MKSTIITLLAFILTACATSGQWGNYADATPAHTAQMAADAFKELSFLYPPAKTHLSVQQPINDPFGILLVQKLRKAGYGVAEQSPISSKSRKPTAAPAASGLPFNYVVDRINFDHYRVSFNVGGQALNRLYQIHGADLAPAGLWAKQE
jgi:hypothetical protein